MHLRILLSPLKKKFGKMLFYKIKPGEGENFWRYRKNITKATPELGDEISLRVWRSSFGGIPGRVLVTYGKRTILDSTMSLNCALK
ncbi:MAG: hypothetical protein CBB92_00540 [Flammeovirgaceae bacterium TMED32]|nr:MAG: hypothetical protein CBB92_00540 [Flammeovirgaceae bacterium TMED32]